MRYGGSFGTLPNAGEMDIQETVEEKPIAGYAALAKLLTDEGYPTSRSTVTKYCAPSVNIGPPVESYWGKLPIFKPSRVLAWARGRLKPAGAARSRPAVTSDAGRAAGPDDRSTSAGLPARKLSPLTPEPERLRPERASRRPGRPRKLLPTDDGPDLV